VAQAAEEEITLRCGDDLGAAYALLSVSERLLGVQPLGWWMGLAPKRLGSVSVPCQSWESPRYRVRFRGWFVNDEVLFSGWHSEENARAEVWERVFETVLRCGGNMVIPGTDRGFDGHVLNEMALERGLWLTQHHTELLGAKMFARVYPDLQPPIHCTRTNTRGCGRNPSTDTRAGAWYGLWASGARATGRSGRTTGKRIPPKSGGAFIARVMRRQMELVRAKDPAAHFCTNLYGEMMALYRKGICPCRRTSSSCGAITALAKWYPAARITITPAPTPCPAKTSPAKTAFIITSASMICRPPIISRPCKTRPKWWRTN
jgi:hypothetical protein